MLIWVITSCSTSKSKLVNNHENPNNTFIGVNSFLIGNVSKSLLSTNNQLNTQSLFSTQQRFTNMKKPHTLLDDTAKKTTSIHYTQMSQKYACNINTTIDSFQLNNNIDHTSFPINSDNTHNNFNTTQSLIQNQCNDIDRLA